MNIRPQLFCTRCGHPIEDHGVYHDAPPPEMVGRMTEARFPGIVTTGIYCPHLDMVPGEDYIVADEAFPTEKLGPSFAAVSDDDYTDDVDYRPEGWLDDSVVVVPVVELQRLTAIEAAARAYVESDPPRPEWRVLCEALGIEWQQPLAQEEVEKVAATIQMLMGPVDARIHLLETLLNPEDEGEDYLPVDETGAVNPTWGGGTLSYNPSDHDGGPDWGQRDRDHPSDAT